MDKQASSIPVHLVSHVDVAIRWLTLVGMLLADECAGFCWRRDRDAFTRFNEEIVVEIIGVVSLFNRAYRPCASR